MLLTNESNLFIGKMLTQGSASEVFSYQPGQKQHSVQRPIAGRNMLRLPGSVTNDHNDATNRLTLNPTSVIFEEEVFAEGPCKAEFLVLIDFPDRLYDRTNVLWTLHEVENKGTLEGHIISKVV
jgi:hypothetical protein